MRISSPLAEQHPGDDQDRGQVLRGQKDLVQQLTPNSRVKTGISWYRPRLPGAEPVDPEIVQPVAAEGHAAAEIEHAGPGSPGGQFQAQGNGAARFRQKSSSRQKKSMPRPDCAAVICMGL